MKPSIFITGISGFLGRSLLPGIDTKKYKNIYCLFVEEKTDILESYPANFIKIIGDLNNPDSYKSILSKTDTVIHMASVTGKVSPEEYRNNIVLGTEKLINVCKENNVKNFIYLSSIAAKFKKIKRYYYGLAKLEAEKIIEKSELNYIIIRPTMIMGSSAPVFDGFSKLVSQSIIPVFGNGKTKIQPVLNTDIVKIILSILDENYFNNNIIEVGGPDIISINDFVKKIKEKKYNNNKKTKIFHIPMGISVFGLTILEMIVYKFLPITVGQLASFRNDSTSKPDPFLRKISDLKGIDIMVDVGLENKKMVIKDDKKIDKYLVKECKTFCRYLSGMNANEYVIKHYLKYHNISKIEEMKNLSHFDKILLKFAGLHPFFTKFIDIYTKFLKPQTLLRFKLSYLLAILEVSSPYYQKIDLTKGIGKFNFLIQLGFKGGLFALQLILSIIILLPLDVFFKIFSKKNKEPENA